VQSSALFYIDSWYFSNNSAIFEKTGMVAKPSSSLTLSVPTALVVGLTTFLATGSIQSSSISALVAGTASMTTIVIATQQQNTRVKVIQEQLNNQNAGLYLAKQISDLEAKKDFLEREIKSGEKIKGQYEGLESKVEAINSQIIELSQARESLVEKRDVLEARVSAIALANPNLVNLEQREKRISELGVQTKNLEGQAQALNTQVIKLEEQRTQLVEIEAKYLQKRQELSYLESQLDKDQVKLKELTQQAAELEMLRSSYDALFSEKSNFEERLKVIQPEVNRLEGEKQRILQELQEIERRYKESERLRAEIIELEAKLRAKRSELNALSREVEQLESFRNNLQDEIAQLDAEKKNLEKRIRELKGEIEAIEGSANIALKSLREKISGLPATRNNYSSENEFLSSLTSKLRSQGLQFPERIVKAFHTSLKVQDISALVILAGISGTGKSELPQKYADHIGASLVMLPVQPRWDSPQDLQGFYNYVEKKYKPTPLMHWLYQYQNDKNMQGRIVMVLLDEMNLARVEYYFSDFLSKLESRRNGNTFLQIDVGSLALPESDRQVRIPKEFLFIGTMNEDETTQSLSDKVLDRANVLTFGKPQSLELRGKQKAQSLNSTSYLAWDDFSNWMREPDPNSAIIHEVKGYVDRANEIMEKLGHPFAHRVYQAIAKYVVNYPDANHNAEVRHQAIADQFGQKLLPKLRGVMVDDKRKELDEMENLVRELGDEPLKEAFARARQGRYGGFHWQGLVYHEDIS
jgi:predicted  nucleic acid-binding Zn-ribbon protein